MRRGTLNKLEADYLLVLRARLATGEIEWIGEHESMAFDLGGGAKFRPDFPVIVAGGRLELHEVKGFWREAARVRIKVAPARFEFRFVGVTRDELGWHFEEFAP